MIKGDIKGYTEEDVREGLSPASSTGYVPLEVYTRVCYDTDKF